MSLTDCAGAFFLLLFCAMCAFGPNCPLWCRRGKGLPGCGWDWYHRPGMDD